MMGSLPLVEGIWLTPSSNMDKIILTPSPLANFQHRISNRSPVESPPLLKKAMVKMTSLTENSNQDRFFGQGFDERMYESTRQGKTGVGKENRSILKRNTLNQKDFGTLRNRRRVDFEPSVRVFHFDKVAGDHVGSESQTLSSEPKDRREFMNRAFQSKFRTVSLDIPTSNPSNPALNNIDFLDGKPARKSLMGNSEKEPLILFSPVQNAERVAQQSVPLQQTTSRPLPVLQTPTAITSTSPDSSISSPVDFTFFEDEARRLRIKFTIALGSGISATDVLVKANMTGNKVRVIASRTVRSGTSGEQKEEFSERYLLPMEVDPYLIMARLDGMGNLFVEAPIMTAERKRALAAEKQTKLNATNNGVVGFSL